MVRIIVDSASDMPAAMQEELGIRTVPLQVTIGEEHYRDWVDLTPEVLYRRLRTEDVVPVTSQPVTSEWEEQFARCREDGEDVLVLTLSSQLSGTYQGAVLAAREFPGMGIELCDCRTASLGVSLMASMLAARARAGAELAELREVFEDLNRRLHTYVIVGDMEMLKRGGRISGTSALIGSMLNIKPVLRIGGEGKLEPLEKARGFRKALSILADLYEKHADRDAVCMIADGDNPEELANLESLLQERFAGIRLEKLTIGAVIGSHVGPGTVGMVFLEK